jgi:hypothetical protein
MNQMEDEGIQDMAYRIAEKLKENDIDARRAEPILWMLLSNVYRLLKKKDGIYGNGNSTGSFLKFC